MIQGHLINKDLKNAYIEIKFKMNFKPQTTEFVKIRQFAWKLRRNQK